MFIHMLKFMCLFLTKRILLRACLTFPAVEFPPYRPLCGVIHCDSKSSHHCGTSTHSKTFILWKTNSSELRQQAVTAGRLNPANHKLIISEL